MSQRIDPPVTRESIEAAQLAAAVERAAAGLICDSDGRIVFALDRKNADHVLARPA